MNLFPPQITDIHTHCVDAPDSAILNIDPQQPMPHHPPFLSVGLHPWQTDNPDAEQIIALIAQKAELSRIVAIGEVGLDALRGADIARQERLFKAQIAISETARKPIIIHCVRAFDTLLRIHKELNPTQSWIIHGFRGKPTLARQLLNAGINISLGEYFNPDTAREIPADRLYYETDESQLSIEEIKTRIAHSRSEHTL